MPCYGKENVDLQRGGGVFRRSIAGLQMLNAAGYGHPGSGLTLDLVYNPSGAFLAQQQATLETAYKQELREGYGIEFNSLLCLNNMPIKRFWEYLQQRGQLEEYTSLLVGNLNPSTGEHVMCRDTVSVSWDGHMCAPSAQPRSLIIGHLTTEDVTFTSVAIVRH
jgi:radical SAM/Cys-rich protein